MCITSVKPKVPYGLCVYIQGPLLKALEALFVALSYYLSLIQNGIKKKEDIADKKNYRNLGGA